MHPLLATRWSPTTFDPAGEVSRSDVNLLLDAARWAPSAGNSQPWAFIAGRRGDDTHERLVRHLAGSSARWAPTASLLVANLSHRYVEDTDWEYSEFSQYDLGQPVAHMTLQAQALGLFVRQFRAFDRASLAADFAVPAYWEVTTMSAVGRVPRPGGDESDARGPAALGRQRRPVEEVIGRSPENRQRNAVPLDLPHSDALAHRKQTRSALGEGMLACLQACLNEEVEVAVRPAGLLPGTPAWPGSSC